jgi:membrane fusion protein (multidrug efflux system)
VADRRENTLQARRADVEEMETTRTGPEPVTAPEADDEETSRARRARSYFQEHPRTRWVLLLVVVLLAAAAFLAWRHYSVRETTDDAQIDGHIVNVSSRVSGTVIKVNVDDNQFVNAGDVIVQLDPKDYQVAIDRAKAELADAQASSRAASIGVPITATGSTSQVATAQANVAAANQEVAMAKARQAEAQANYNKVAADLKRFQQLVAKDEISRQQYDAQVAAEQAARATLDAAVAAVSTAQSHVAQAEANLRSAKTAPEQIQVQQAKAGSAQAAAQRAQSALEQAQLNLQYTTVRAPFAGIVSKRTVEPGQVVQAGQPLIAIVNLDDLWVTANYKETQLQKMRVGQKAKCHVDAYDRDLDCHVDSIGGATGARFSLLPPENATGNYVKVVQRVPVKLVFEPNQDPQHKLRPGMSVVPTVFLDSEPANTQQNTGQQNTGQNTGQRNTGPPNTGQPNTGQQNTGQQNPGQK